MRILLVGLNYAPEVVGIAPYNTELAEHLASRGHQVTVLTSFPYYPHWQIDPSYRRRPPFVVESINGVRVVRSPFLLPGSRQSAFRRILFDSSLAVTTLMASAGLGALDTVICVSPPLQLGVTSWLIARSRRARLILHLQDIVPDAALSMGMMREGKAARLARQLEHFVYFHADEISVISQGFFDNLARKGVPKAKLILAPNWVDTARFQAVRDSDVRAALGASDGETLVLHTGNMGAKQGLETVIDSAALLGDDSVVVTLIGDGNHRRELEARATALGLKNLKFRPLQADYSATLAAADVLVLAQRGRVVDSVAPSKLLSYMGSGKPVAAAVNQLSEAGRLVSLAKCGIVVPPEEPAALAAALRELHSRPERCSEFGDSGRRYVTEHFNRSTILRHWVRLVEERTRVGGLA
jgi:colanic acid biosynthesis glycosyl transferase WcaI